ncbi:MAG: hypothetical protein JW940_29160 [Polyangiaceae bacterium]|nr:hypothetical protein [Polyangiaceae bacterium]
MQLPRTRPAHCSVCLLRQIEHARWLARIALLALVAVALSTGCAAKGGPNLLAGLRPVRSQGVPNQARITDSVRAPEGEDWESSVSAAFSSPQAFVEYDLGQRKPIDAAYVQGDNNDEYVLEGSDDGTHFRVLWVAPVLREPGLRARSAEGLGASARYLRISVRGGDRRFALSEVQVYSGGIGSLSSSMRERSGVPTPVMIRSKVLILLLCFGVWLAVTRRQSSWIWAVAAAALPVWAASSLYKEVADAWPIPGREVAFVRAAAAALAGLAILRELIARRVYPAHRGVVLTTLGISAIAGFMAFFNLGHPQFEDRKAKEPLFVHNFDMRVYYPVAKYFKELRYDGLYKASVAAYVDDVPGVTLDSLRNVELRDLRNHRMSRLDDSQVRAEVEAMPQRFSPERWQAFKADMRYFRETMGLGDYLGTMHDHGANATPVWLAIAHLVFAHTTASNTTLTLTGLLDPLLLLVALMAIGRTYGLRTMLVSMVVFGANDYYMFGSNWGGATLRHDWMAYLALGLCALKVERWVLGGALLALSAAIRAFPVVALATLAIPVGWWLWDRWLVQRRLPRLNKLLREQRPVLLTAAGAAACALVVWLGSSLLFSFDAWTEWLAKVSLLDRDPHVNHISLRGLVAGSDHLQLRVLHQRIGLFAALIAVSVVAIVFASRRKPLDQVATLGTLLIPIAFNPANYYIHFIFVLPILALERPRPEASSGRPALSGYDGWLWGVLLVACAAQYWETLVSDLDLHFQIGTVLLFTTFTALLTLVLSRDMSKILPSLAAGSLPGDPGHKPRSRGRAPSPESKAAPPDGTQAATPGEATDDPGRANAPVSEPHSTAPAAAPPSEAESPPSNAAHDAEPEPDPAQARSRTSQDPSTPKS